MLVSAVDLDKAIKWLDKAIKWHETTIKETKDFIKNDNKERGGFI